MTRKVLGYGTTRTRKTSPIRSLLSDPEFVSSCANFASFVGDTFTSAGKPVQGKLLNEIASAARENLIPKPGIKQVDNTVQARLTELATEWSAMTREDDPDEYDRIESEIEELQKKLNKSGDKSDS